MNGSRTNSKIKKDRYQDYDLVLIVEETHSFLENNNWLASFGTIAVMQEPNSKTFGWGKEISESENVYLAHAL